MTLHPNDYRVITASFKELFGAYLTPRRPRGLTHPNFMTPEVLGYLDIGGPVVEISYGTGMDHEPIFGVTWSRLADGTCDPRDRLCFSLQEVRTYLMDIGGHHAHGLP